MAIPSPTPPTVSAKIGEPFVEEHERRTVIVNRIGDDVHPALQQKRGRPNRVITLLNPDGVPEEVALDNKTDLMRNHGYTMAPSTKSEIKAATASDETDGEGDDSKLTPDQVVETSRAKEVQAAASYVDTMRAALIAKGVDPDRRWGIARLRTEMEKVGLEPPDHPE